MKLMCRKMIHLYLQTICLFSVSLLLICSDQLQASLRIEKLDYKGWHDAHRISNGKIELIIVPQIGRIMSLSHVGQENILWENLQESGNIYLPTQKKWINYGGYKLWLAPQSELGWPPDPYIDRGCYSFDVIDDQTIRLLGVIHPVKMLRLSIDIKLIHGQSELVLTHRMENHSKQSMAVSFWGVSQVKPNGQISVIPTFWQTPIWDLKLSEIKQIPSQNIIQRSDLYHLAHRDIPDKKKVYFFLENAVMTYDWDGYRFIKQFDPYQRFAYPEADSNFEVYFCPQYIELETVSPLITVDPGQSGQDTVRWKLCTMDRANEQLINRKQDQ
jgi:hypothetical protein